MRTTKRFTPQVIARFIKQGRGEGTYTDYIPWHQVGRGDPASSGRSHLLNWRGRLRELLSDGELVEQYFAAMLPDIDDCIEQYRLTPAPSPHALAAYGERDGTVFFPGTEELAKRLGIRHPTLKDGTQSALWRLTTDLVLVFKGPTNMRHVLALAFKPKDWNKKKRTRELLSLEREFWTARNVPWLLITPELYNKRVACTLRRIACWVLAEEAPSDLRDLAARVAKENPCESLTWVLEAVCAAVGSLDLAQRALWQAVWYGKLPIDLTRGWRPHIPLKFVSEDQFHAFNPITSRRSAWI